MPRYFFNVHHGANHPDRSGTEFKDARTAQTAAIRHAANFLAEGASAIECGDDWFMEVQDEDSLTLFRLDFRIASSLDVLAG